MKGFIFGFIFGIILAINYYKQQQNQQQPNIYYNKKVVLTCIVQVQKPRFLKSLKQSWAKGCDSIYTYAKQNIKNIEAKRFEVVSSWHLLCEVIRDLVRDTQWALFIQEDTFPVIAHLKTFLQNKDPEKAFYLGHATSRWGTPYNHAGAGFVLSQGALILLWNRFTNSEECKEGGRYWNTQDYYLGKHLADMGVFPMDTRDEFGRARFHAHSLDVLLIPGRLSSLSSFHQNSLYPIKEGPECCSNTTITFSAVDPHKMHIFHYLLSCLKIKANRVKDGPPPPPPPGQEVWKLFLKDLGIPFNVTPQQYLNLWTRELSPPELFGDLIQRYIQASED